MEESSHRQLLTVRPYSPSDYVILNGWWTKWKQSSPPEFCLPVTGIMIEVDGTPSACGFIYNTDSAMCLFDWPVSNPFINKDIRGHALDRLIDESQDWATEQGYKTMYTSKCSTKFIDRLEKKGFLRGSSNNVHMFYRSA